MSTPAHSPNRRGTQLAPTPKRWTDAAELAARQHGVVSREQLRKLGLSDRQITRAMANARLHRIHRGVFAVGHARLVGTGLRMAAVLACGDSAVLGYRAAAEHWNLRPMANRATEVVLSRRVRPRHRNVIVHCHPQMASDEFTIHDGIPVTTVARTLLDVSAVLPPQALRRVVAQADTLGLFDLRAVEELTSRHRNHRGRRRLEEVLRSWEEPDRVRSDLERDFPALCASFGFPRPSINAVVLGMEVDAVFFDHGVAVELDGYEFHSRRLQWEDDHDRRARLTAAGWIVVAFSWRQVTADGGRAVRDVLGPALAQGAERRRAGLSAPIRSA